MTNLAATKAIFVDHKPLQSRSVGRLIFEVPIEQYDAALGALGGTPLPGESRWFAIARLTKQPQGQDDSGSAPSPSLADAADSPAAASEVGSAPGLASGWSPPQAPARGAAEPATKPKKHWDDYSPSQQAGIVCNDHRFDDWLGGPAPEARWDGETIAAAPDFTSAADYVRWYCGVSSRSDLDTNPEAAKRWRELHSMFTADTQYGDRR